MKRWMTGFPWYFESNRPLKVRNMFTLFFYDFFFSQNTTSRANIYCDFYCKQNQCNVIDTKEDEKRTLWLLDKATTRFWVCAKLSKQITRAATFDCRTQTNEPLICIQFERHAPSKPIVCVCVLHTRLDVNMYSTLPADSIYSQQ